MFKENLSKKGPLSREFGPQEPIHMGSIYQYPPPGFEILSVCRNIFGFVKMGNIAA